MLIKNKTRATSFAEHKVRFKGENGEFNPADLAAWFQVWDQTTVENQKAAKHSEEKNTVFGKKFFWIIN